MRILQVAHQFVDTNRRGAELHAYYLSRTLSTEHDVAVFYPSRGRPSPGAEQGTFDGLTTFVVGFGSSWEEALTRSFDPGKEAAFEEVVRSWQPDVVHFHHLIYHSLKLPSIAKRLGARTVFTLHDFWLLCPQVRLLDHNGRVSWPIDRRNCGRCCLARTGRTHSWRRLWGWDPLLLARRAAFEYYLRHRRPRMIARMARDVDVFLAPSRDLKRRFEEEGFPGGKILHSPYGIERSLRGPGYGRPARRSRPLNCAYLGGLLRHKGVDVLLEAFRGLEGARLRIYGHPDAAYTGRSLGTNVEIAGEMSEAGKAEMFRQTDVVVVPSIWLENSPIVIREAFLFGVPVIVPDIGGMTELVRDGHDGLLFRPGDAQDLRRKLRRLIEDRTELGRLAANVPAVRSIADHAREVAGIYRRLLDGERLAE